MPHAAVEIFGKTARLELTAELEAQLRDVKQSKHPGNVDDGELAKEVLMSIIEQTLVDGHQSKEDEAVSAIMGPAHQQAKTAKEQVAATFDAIRTGLQVTVS